MSSLICTEHNAQIEYWDQPCKKGICNLCIIDHQHAQQPEPVWEQCKQILIQKQIDFDQLKQQVDKCQQFVLAIQSQAEKSKSLKIETMKNTIKQKIEYLQIFQNKLEQEYQDNFYNKMVQETQKLHQSIYQHSVSIQQKMQQINLLLNDNQLNVFQRLTQFMSQDIAQSYQRDAQEQKLKIDYFESSLQYYQQIEPEFIEEKLNLQDIFRLKVPEVTSFHILQDINSNAEVRIVPSPKKFEVDIEWDTIFKSQNIEINNKFTAQKKGEFTYSSILMNNGFDEGVIEIQLQIDNTGDEKLKYLCVGVLENPEGIEFETCWNGFEQPPEKVWAISNQGILYEPLKKCIGPNQHLQFQKGNIIKIELDFDNEIIQFSVNDNQKTKLIGIQGTLTPFVSFGCKNQQVTIKKVYKQISKKNLLEQGKEIQQSQIQQQFYPSTEFSAFSVERLETLK